MNALDVVILVTFFASTLIGAMRGFTKELLSLFSWGGAVTLSYVFLPAARHFVQPYIANPMMADGAAIFCLFIVSLILLSIIANIIAGYIHESSFRGVDHSLGFGFGILRGVVFISAAELIFSTFSPRHAQSSTFQNARFIPMVRKGGDTVLQILPGSVREWVLEQAIKVENQLQAKVKENFRTDAGGPSGAGQPDPSNLTHGRGSPHQPHDGQPYNGQPFNGQPYNGQPQGGQPYSGQLHDGQQPRQDVPPALPLTIHGHPGGQPPQGPQNQSQMVVIRPPQPGQVPQLATAPEGAPVTMSPSGNQQGGSPASSLHVDPSVRGIGQSAIPRDTQATVDELARLKPRATEKEEGGYTRGQRDDMNRLFQAADGE